MRTELVIENGEVMVVVTEIQTGKVCKFGPFGHDEARQLLLYGSDTLRDWFRNGRS